MGSGASAALMSDIEKLDDHEDDRGKIKKMMSRHVPEEKLQEEEAKLDEKIKEHEKSTGKKMPAAKAIKSLYTVENFDDVDDDSGVKTMTEEEARAAGEALGNMFKQKAEAGTKMKEHKALVFDCGTGETKAIYLHYTFDEEAAKNRIEVKEMRKAPATLNFLKRARATDNEDYKKKLGKINKSKDSDEDKAKAIAKLRDGFWFLDEKPDGAEDKLIPDYFVEYCLQVKKELEDQGNKPETVMIGCSAWARNAGSLQDEADKLVISLTKAGLLCKKLLQRQEGTFEAAAVNYAYATMTEKDEDRTPLSGLIGSGGGSVQFLHSMKHPINLDCGNIMCLDAMLNAYNDESEEEGLKSLQQCFKLADDFATTEKADSSGLRGKVFGEIVEERQRTEQALTDPKERALIKAKLGGAVIAISACYYGAVSVKMANKEDEAMAMHAAKDVVAAMAKRIGEVQEELKTCHKDRGERKTKFKEIANLKLQTVLFDTLLDPDCKMCFKRNWKLDGVPFRTTWTAGWYLNYLYSLGLRFGPGTDGILAEHAKTEAEGAELMKDAGDALAGAGNEGVAMVLVDLKTIIKQMRAVALKIANPIDKFLHKIAETYQGKLQGWPTFKVKGEGSLYRKLISTIFEMLQENEDIPSYTPNIEECVSSIHDCLRYTITFPPEQYTAAVKAIEGELLVGEGHRGKSIKFKNFWRDGDGETCYQGINAQVRLGAVQDLGVDEKPLDRSDDVQEKNGFTYSIPQCTGEEIPNSDNFIFELQLHTEQSFEMKNGPGHLLYEMFRDPNKKQGTVKGKFYDGSSDEQVLAEFKRQVYFTNKALFNSKGLKPGDIVEPGLKKTYVKEDGTHDWSEEDYLFVPFKPTESMVSYDSGIPGAHWRNELKIYKKLEQEAATAAADVETKQDDGSGGGGAK